MFYLLFALLLVLIGGFGILLVTAGANTPKPSQVNTRDWERVTHVPHTPGFRRVK